MADAAPAELVFPHASAPAPGACIEVVPGILWLRLALPFALNHVNIYLIDDGAGWVAIDTGVADARTRAVWEGMLAGGLGGRPITRLIVTHFHPDHVGLAGWLAERCGVGVSMSQLEYLHAQLARGNPAAGNQGAHRGFYARHGLSEEQIEGVMVRGDSYRRLTTDLPTHFERLRAGDVLRIGGRDFEVLTGGGHAYEQVMLLCREARLFLPADQVLARISPNIGVSAWEPLADPLADYLASLAALRVAVAEDVLVLPTHNLPFVGLHQRLGELALHHRLRCDEVADAVGRGTMSAAEVMPVLFPRAMDPHQTGFAFGEVLAHVNYMLGLGELVSDVGADGVMRVVRR